MKLSTEQISKINDIRNNIIRLQQESEILYIRAKLLLNTNDDDAYLHDYVYGNIQASSVLKKLKKKDRVK